MAILFQYRHVPNLYNFFEFQGTGLYILQQNQYVRPWFWWIINSPLIGEAFRDADKRTHKHHLIHVGNSDYPTYGVTKIFFHQHFHN